MLTRILSIDYDGCLASPKFTNSSEKCIIKSNDILLNYILDSSDNFEQTTIFDGSNRQSFNIDFMNSFHHGNGSCFPQTKKIADYLKEKDVKNINFDNFLLADIYGNLEFGESLKLIEKGPDSEAQYSDWVFDDEKITLTYAQIHKSARDNLDKNIVYEFCDDRKDILSNLHAFYSQYPDLLPKNVLLKLNFYNGEGISQYEIDIKGIGNIDSDFRNTVKIMAVISTEMFSENKRFQMNIEGTSVYFMNPVKIHPSNDVTPDRIQKYRQENNIAPESILPEVEDETSNLILGYMYNIGFSSLGLGIAASLLGLEPTISCLLLGIGSSILLYGLIMDFIDNGFNFFNNNQLRL